jgi:hypothetical protein
VQVALERAEHASTFRGTDIAHKRQLSNLAAVCVDLIGHRPDMILQDPELWKMIPNHLKYRIQKASRRYRGSELTPSLLEKLFAVDDMDVLDLDDLPGVSSGLLRAVTSNVDLSTLTFISMVGCTRINSNAVASLLRHSPNLSHFNVKGCVNLSDAAFPEKILVKELKQLTYVNLSFTQVGAKSLTLLYAHCPKLEVLKLAGCKITDKQIPQIFTHPSDVLVSLKFRHCNVSNASLKRILENFPNLHTLDFSSTDLRSLRPLLAIPHQSQLRKLNISNCRELRPSQAEFSELFRCNPDLEHIYTTNARLDDIPSESLEKLKTLFVPGMYSAQYFLPHLTQHGHNLTYLDLSRSDVDFRTVGYYSVQVFNTPNLRILSLQDTHIHDDGAELLSQIHSLRSLFLRGTAISAVGLRQIVYGCPWLEEVDLSSCRRIDFRERRTILATLQTEFKEKLAEVGETGQIWIPELSDLYIRKTVQNGDEERDALVRIPDVNVDSGFIIDSE